MRGFAGGAAAAGGSAAAGGGSAAAVSSRIRRAVIVPGHPVLGHLPRQVTRPAGAVVVLIVPHFGHLPRTFRGSPGIGGHPYPVGNIDGQTS